VPSKKKISFRLSAQMSVKVPSPHLLVSLTYFYCQVNVKWGKEKYDNVEIDTSEPPLVFKSQLFALTRVPPDRQKSKCPARNQKNIYLVLR